MLRDCFLQSQFVYRSISNINTETEIIIRCSITEELLKISCDYRHYLKFEIKNWFVNLRPSFKVEKIPIQLISLVFFYY